MMKPLIVLPIVLVVVIWLIVFAAQREINNRDRTIAVLQDSLKYERQIIKYGIGLDGEYHYYGENKSGLIPYNPKDRR